MASPARSGFPARTNSRLDAFLRRHLPPEVYDAVRAYEPCIVVSDAEKHTFRYVVLSDRLIYLTENPPKSIRRVVALRDVVAIDLIDDYPEFLNSPDREINQHIRIVYSSTVLKKERGKPKGVGKFLFPIHHSSVNPKVKQDNNGPTFWRRKDPRSRNESSLRSPQANSVPFKDSAPCPSDLKQLFLPGQGASRPLPTLSRTSQSAAATGQAACSPPPPFAANTGQQEPPDYKDTPREIPPRFDGNRNECRLRNSLPASPSHSSSSVEKEESELHLYVISETSSIFLHLKSSWNNYIIRATLSQDPLCSSGHGHVIGNPKPYRSEEKIKHFSQLKSELFLQDNTLSKILCLITELRVAAQRNFILKRLFWKTSELFYFLVNKLHEYLPESRDKSALQNKSQRANELVACIEITQTLGLMFRETEVESSRLSTLAAKLQALILEYTDTATALLFEILLVFQQGNLALGSTKFAISWMMSFLQSCPPTVAFVASIVKRVARGLSASLQLLTPCQAVLLYQQFYILRSCLQYSKALAEHIRSDHSEEFRYFIHMPALEKRLPVSYPITEPTTQLCHEVLQLIEQRQYAKF
uniref:RIKEN cDNA D930020B18 gene n=1 Tax=Peromyscus maniculatus bairdii TaxID=230844 RepID=A0A8C8TW25_PERMB